ncbi:tetrapyrrole-binding protein, chloroplastic-like [Cynara cardunculus var. scolymus]|uniref:GUN4-like protein n=1 Tax=Cynara cardunculus var. scolymus TaxID=59895 RepID=A0A118K059_CYNCS|nr:tetrapyrrole-binding protein, chloroplastic-like [Cynara cardunculus var. scolymus]KVI00990.1 GUN4-like protein [Cynara cardunculus var. scolymus]
MATNSLQSLNYRHHNPPPPPPGRRQSFDCTPPVSFSVKLNNNNNPTLSISSAVKTFSLPSTTSSSATSSTSDQSTTVDQLQRLLSAKDFREADNETRRLLIALAGEAAQKRGYVFFSEVQFIPESDLQTIDELWRNHSNNKFGYSVQKRLWEKSNRDFTTFFIKVGWMKKLDTEVLQYNYRAFPDEFVWELTDETPEGHLPLTNALRGTQLLKSVLSHPAFADKEDAIEEEEEKQEESQQQPLGKGMFKPDYSF